MGWRVPPELRRAKSSAATTGAKRGRRAYSFWGPTKTATMKYLKNNGVPDVQARVEDVIADYLAAHGHEAGERAIRDHASHWITEFEAAKKGTNS
jgi:hypothetical protein